MKGHYIQLSWKLLSLSNAVEIGLTLNQALPLKWAHLVGVRISDADDIASQNANRFSIRLSGLIEEEPTLSGAYDQANE